MSATASPAPSPAAPGSVPVNVEDLRIVLSESGADIVDEIDLTIAPGQVLGLVGESGSGKTTVGMA
jgi:peptide/nickel transport system ATP-binding protein